MLVFEGGGRGGSGGDGGGGGDKEPPSKMSRVCSFSRVEVDGVGKEQPPSKTRLCFRGQGLRHDEEGFTPPGHVGNGIWCDEEG